MKNKYIKNELKREVELLTPENMLNEIKNKNAVPKRVLNKNISVISETGKRRSIVPIIASCVASVILCLAIFLPIALKSKDEYRTWLANKQAQQTQIEQEYEQAEQAENK